MRKWLNDLTYNELKIFVNRYGSDIAEKVFDRALDDAYSWIDTYLEEAPRNDVDYMYFDRGEHFTVNDATYKFMDWIDGVQADYEWLNQSTYEKCKRAYELWKADRYERDLSDEEWEEYEKLKDEIGSEIFTLMKSEYDAAFDDDHRVEIFNAYADEFFDEPIDEIWVDTDTWEYHTMDDLESEDLDYDLDEQLEIPEI